VNGRRGQHDEHGGERVEIRIAQGAQDRAAGVGERGEADRVAGSGGRGEAVRRAGGVDRGQGAAPSGDASGSRRRPDDIGPGAAGEHLR